MISPMSARPTALAAMLIGLLLSSSGCAQAAQPAPATPIAVATSPTPEETCTVISPEPTQESASVVPPESDEDFVIGPASALVTIIEYCDFQAPICQSMAAVIGNVLHDHPEDVRFVFRPIALAGQLDKSELALQAALAAGRQGKFWEMYDQLYLRNQEWADLTPAQFDAWLQDAIVDLGLDVDAFSADLVDDEIKAQSAARFQAAAAIGNLRLPFLLINGQPQPTFAIDSASVEAAVDLITLSKRQFTACPPMTIDPSHEYVATLHTEKGDIVIRLHPDDAPLAVNSFVFLARSGWFDGVIFHRVLPGFVAQTGDPSGTGQGNPGYLFKNEISDTKFDRSGLVAMANSGPDTNGSQFFITYAPAPHLDGGYTIFGSVVQGMEVVEMLTPRNPEELSGLPKGDLLLSVEIQQE